MKVTVYTINDCKFSQSEKQYLQAKNIPFEEKNLESNREFLTEMLSISNNFAGTPVTKIEKDDGQVMVLKGFTPEEFDKAFGVTSVVPPAAAPMPMQPPKIETTPPPMPAPVVPLMPMSPAPKPVPADMVSPVQQVAPINPTPANPPIQSANDTVLQAAEPALAPMTPPPIEAPAPTQPMNQNQGSQEALSSVLQDLQARVNTETPQETS